MTNPETANPGAPAPTGLLASAATTSASPAGVGRAGTDAGEVRVWTVSLVFSLIVHAALMAAGIAIVWRIKPVDLGDAPGSLAWLDDDRQSIEPSTLRPGASEPAAPAAAPAPQPAAGTDLLESLSGDSSPDPLGATPGARASAGVVRAGPVRSLTSSGELSASGDAFLSNPVRRSAPHAETGGQGLTRSGAHVRFGGLGAARARSVVYVVDASGPMVTSLAAVVAELSRSVARLEPTQRFTVIFFRELNEEGAGVTRYSAFRPALVRATSQNTAEARAWAAGMRPGGRSNPLDGLRAALELKPDVVFLLSRSIERSAGGVWGAGKERILTELESLNQVDPLTGRRATLIRTIQFLDEDPTGIMQAIAAAHGAGDSGEGYRVVPPGTELGRD